MMDRSRQPDDGWMHSALQVRPSTIAGSGLFTTEPLADGEIVVQLAGRLISTDELHALFAATEDEYIDTVAVDLDTHLVLPAGTGAHFGNHSCEPTMWWVSGHRLATRHALDGGAELTVDYGTISDDATFQMVCDCRATTCRRVITGQDWRLPALQGRYAGHWPPGLQRRIDRSR